MKQSQQWLICWGFLLSSCGLFAQFTRSVEPSNNVWEGNQELYRRSVGYTHLREADVMWAKRVWRRIDLRHKINHPLYYPERPLADRMSLFDLIKEGVLGSETETYLTAYSTGYDGTNDEFTLPMTREEVRSILVSYDTVATPSLVDDGWVEEVVTIEVGSADIKMYELKEEWFFDKQRSVLDVRIIGICPVMETYDEYGNFKGCKRLFWIYLPEARQAFAKTQMFNRFNQGARLTLDDIFSKRMFDSYITKESNVYDRFIVEYKVGLGALVEADEIKEGIFEFEEDLWHY